MCHLCASQRLRNFAVSCLVLSCLVLSCHVLLSAPLPYLVLSCLVLSCLVFRSLALPCLVLTAIIFYCLLSPAVTNMPKDKTPGEAFVAIVQGKRSCRLAEKEQASPSKTSTNKSAGSTSQQSSPAKLPSRVTQVRSPAKEQASPSKTTTNKSAGSDSQQSSPAKEPAETHSVDPLVVPTTDNISANENVSPPPTSKSTVKGLLF